MNGATGGHRDPRRRAGVLRFQAAAQACGIGLVWQVVWWWPAGAPQPGPAGLGPARSVRQ